MAAFLSALVGLTLSAMPTDDLNPLPPAESRVAILRTAERFQKALLAKDRGALQNLFLPMGVAWFQVVGTDLPPSSSRPEQQAGPLRPGTPERFITNVVSTDHVVEERFRNPVIDTDGKVASLTFDYDFLLDGKIANSGHEMWQLVKIDEEWKICALTYSVTKLAAG